MAALAPAAIRARADQQWAAVTARARTKAIVTEPTEGFAYGHAYEGARYQGAWFQHWNTTLMSADREWLPSRWNAIGRTRDLLRNEVIAGAAIARRKNSAIGKGWRFSSKPDARALNITPEQATELGRQIETELRHYLYSHSFMCDAERSKTWGQQLRVVASHLMMDGEFLALVEWADDEPDRYKTRLRLVDPDRLSNPFGELDSDTLRGGVERNAKGVPIRYWIRERHPNDLGLSSYSLVWNGWDRWTTPLGRPGVLHGFDPERAGQTRGVTRFAAALKSFRALSRFTDATLQSATINALILGYVQSGAGPDAIKDAFTADDLRDHESSRQDFYEEHPVKLGDAEFLTMPLGDEIKFATASKDVTQFDAFTTAIIRMIAAQLGVTYEEISMDYSKTNYSSARAALIHAWNETLAFMGVIEDQLARPFLACILEEAFDAGYLTLPEGAPDFYDAIDAYCAGRWFGPGRGAIDPVKEVLAAAARMEAGITTLEDECAMYDGGDWQQRTDQRAVEEAYAASKGLPSEIAALDEAAQDTKNPFKAPPAPPPDNADDGGDQTQPAPKPGARVFHMAAKLHRPAMARVERLAMSAAHDASLDARPQAA